MDVVRYRTGPDAPFTYSDLLEAQEQAYRRLESTGVGSLLLAEVDPVITLGKRGGRGGLLNTDEAAYLNQGITLLEVNRGGEATYHGPGVLVVFLVERVERLVGDSKAVRRLTERLLGAVLRAVQSPDGAFEIREGCEVGIWKIGTQDKIASLGIELRNRTLLHGIAINIYREGPSYFGLNPCAIEGARPGYLLSEKDDARFHEVSNAVVQSFKNEFGLSIELA